jgi:hypothetical protein
MTLEFIPNSNSLNALGPTTTTTTFEKALLYICLLWRGQGYHQSVWTKSRNGAVVYWYVLATYIDSDLTILF